MRHPAVDTSFETYVRTSSGYPGLIIRGREPRSASIEGRTRTIQFDWEIGNNKDWQARKSSLGR